MRVGALFAAAVVLTLGGCFHPLHVPPKAGQPSATVKFRINHMPPRTGRLRFRLLIDEHSVVHQPPRGGPSATWTRVKPGWRVFGLHSLFYYTRSYRQAYTAYTSYRCGTRTCSRSQTRYRTVTQMVPTGRCNRRLAVWTRPGQTYLFNYSYLGNFSCQLACYQQTHAGSGRFNLRPCAHTKHVR